MWCSSNMDVKNFAFLVAFAVAVQAAPTCPLNEEIRDGGFDCQTCQNYAVVFCMALHEKKCYCKDGYVRDNDNDNQCVQTVNCTIKYFNFIECE
nr:PREDICTED: uncharacterized protein LOC103312613 isoform X2 [Tribolium castaneum]XP_015834435.1 PREDICTED: uncharacterized protein LOC103312613 isoform X2 [Tribolium castaneum]|eukprot:XP_008191889.1 PREDICTED: uncharacterized protein LOC103312613 isoform X2 [Tribolium castaneum]